MPSTDRGLSRSHRAELLGLARRAIEAGLDGGRLAVPLAACPTALLEVRASFVTLRIDQDLRGCIGTVEARRPLAEDVAWNAYAAAFEDPRFPPLSRAEFARIDLHLSLLTRPEPMRFDSEQDLIAQVRPHVDGLVLEEGWRRGTFLPSVWQEVPGVVEFLQHLKRKAGLPPDYWSTTLCVSRYTAESVP